MKCPYCSSANIQCISSEVVGRKTKNVTNININPLKPFTAYNHKEKVINAGYNVRKWHCKECGEMFEDDDKPEEPKLSEKQKQDYIIMAVTFIIMFLFLTFWKI